MSTHVNIGETRLIKSSIKKYAPKGDKKINIYYNASRNRMDVEIFTFPTEEERDDALNTLDTLFL